MYRVEKGKYWSHITKRRYPFKEGDKIDQRRAKAQMEHEVSVLKDAESKRLAALPPDTRSERQKVLDSVTHKRQQSTDLGAATEARIAELRQKQTYATPKDRNRLQRRIDGMEQVLSKHNASVQAAVERKAREDAAAPTIAEAQQLLDDFRFRGDVSQHIVQGASEALNNLKDDLDPAKWRETAKQLRTAYNTDRQHQIDSLRAKQRDLEAQLVAVREDAPPEASTAAL